MLLENLLLVKEKTIAWMWKARHSQFQPAPQDSLSRIQVRMLRKTASLLRNKSSRPAAPDNSQQTSSIS
jgi:hypothetical protein